MLRRRGVDRQARPRRNRMTGPLIAMPEPKIKPDSRRRPTPATDGSPAKMREREARPCRSRPHRQNVLELELKARSLPECVHVPVNSRRPCPVRTGWARRSIESVRRDWSREPPRPAAACSGGTMTHVLQTTASAIRQTMASPTLKVSRKPEDCGEARCSERRTGPSAVHEPRDTQHRPEAVADPRVIEECAWRTVAPER